MSRTIVKIIVLRKLGTLAMCCCFTLCSMMAAAQVSATDTSHAMQASSQTDSTAKQRYPPPVQGATVSGSAFIAGTMARLQTRATPGRPPVRILVYGQSISVQDWWKDVAAYIRTMYPESAPVIENRAIGGFASQILFKTVEMDVSSFYPDLVLLHIYGSHAHYDSVLRTIRSRTAAEVIIQTDHYTGDQRWSDSMSNHLLPSLAAKYRCAIVNVREAWKQYLEYYKLKPSALLKDEVHLNEHGEYLMAELLKPVFRRAPPGRDSLQLVTETEIKNVATRRGDTLFIPFTGNRVDLISSPAAKNRNFMARVLVDGNPPGTFQGCYFMSRPYNEKGDSWPWQLPAMIRIGRGAPWVNEEWACEFLAATPPYDSFKFRIKGSVTGNDGEGTGNVDFVSHSRRVIIARGDADDGGDWHLKRSYQVTRALTPPGSIVKWKTYSIASDTLTNRGNVQPARFVTLFQGIPNGGHVLQIISPHKQPLPFSRIRIYKPPY